MPQAPSYLSPSQSFLTRPTVAGVRRGAVIPGLAAATVVLVPTSFELSLFAFLAGVVFKGCLEPQFVVVVEGEVLVLW